MLRFPQTASGSFLRVRPHSAHKSGADLKTAPHWHTVSILIGGGTSDSLRAFWSSVVNGIELTSDSNEHAIPLANCRTRPVFLPLSNAIA